MSTKTFLAAAAACVLLAGPALAQDVRDRMPNQTGTVVQPLQNSTGNDGGVVISRGATGADTITTDSAAGGNASRPEQAIPNGSANGGGGGR
ncbi:hypothetical protein ASG40_13125 [Methylobacterium sp. Leaf399]|uniref:hypothetical protein n=1 Tax=unclassified Methylobacterium TaxID=2615210 RepID=UPI000701EC85|nr:MULTISPECIES: hypothetical protein [unclassified Methylobacterium]KQP50861.1 hypothetical protein ASF39_11505 [Methylobacterium sp. Leaf108]KQT07843.1 hypothetical protein ASG40_13125 [Methylobacterium sp. Leaf399]